MMRPLGVCLVMDLGVGGRAPDMSACRGGGLKNKMKDEENSYENPGGAPEMSWGREIGIF